MECRRRVDDRARQEAGLQLSDPIDRIPEDRRHEARAALAEAFGATTVAALEPLTSGASALSCRVEVAGRSYLLRLESSRRDRVRNPHRSYGCMRTAAEAGIAPALHHADAATGVAITDFVPARALSDYPGGAPALARDLGGLVARLQATPTFPPVGSYLTVLEQLLDLLLDSGLFVPGLLDRHREGFQRIREAYPWDDGALVSSHNDLNPSNVLFDGERLWLIDWETAYRNDALADVAILSIFFAADPALETELLGGWLGREPDRTLRARLVLMRLLGRLFYGCAASLNAADASHAVAPAADLAAPTPAQFRAAVAEGRLVAGSPEGRRLVGRIALGLFLADLATPAFKEALLAARG